MPVPTPPRSFRAIASRREGTRRIELAACGGMMLGVFIGVSGPDFPTIAGFDLGTFGILAAWTLNGGAVLALALSRQGQESAPVRKSGH